MSNKHSSPEMNTNVESETRDATPAESRRIGLIGSYLVRIGFVAVLCGGAVVFGCAVMGLIQFS